LNVGGDFIARLALYFGLIGAAFAGLDGETIHLTTALFLLIDLSLYFVWRPPSLPLIVGWKLAYIGLICREGLMDADVAAAVCGRYAYDTASQYVTAANAALLVGHMVVSMHGPRRVETDPYPVERVIPSRWLFVTLIVLALFLRSGIPSAELMLSGGRSQQAEELEVSVESALVSGLMLTINVGLPSILTYYLVWIRKMRTPLVLACIAPIAVMEVLFGTRFIVLMSLGGVVAILANRQRINRRVLLLSGAVGVLLIMASGIMASTRYEGFASLTLSRYLDYLSENGVIHSEGMVVNLAALINYFERAPYMQGNSTLGILLFWIPRALWLDKPTLMGYWFPRLASSRGFSAGHSIGLTFAADSYADFGFVGGVMFCGIIGIVFGLVDRKVLRLAARPGTPYLVAVAPLYGAAVFAIRSLDTAFIVTTGFTLMGLLTTLFSTRRGPAPAAATASLVGARSG
jgi:oligosaccharide repeat unit polymerase